MGIITGGGSKDKKIDIKEQYKYSNGIKTLYYIPGEHPGSFLLPPKAVMYKKNCPQSLKNQIFDEDTYDIHGRFAIAYEDGLLEAPVGMAKKDYEKWLKTDAQAAQEIDEYVREQLEKYGYKSVPLNGGDEKPDDPVTPVVPDTKDDDKKDDPVTPVVPDTKDDDDKKDDPVVPDEPSEPVVPDVEPDVKPDPVVPDTKPDVKPDDDPVVPDPKPDDKPDDPVVPDVKPDEPVVPDVKPDDKPDPVVPDVKPDPTPVVPDTKDDDKDKPKDPDDIRPNDSAEWWKYHEDDWKSEGSARVDREKLENNIWGTFHNPSFNNSQKAGKSFLHVMQYYYKRKQEADDLQAIEDQGIGAAIRDELNDRFAEQNKELIEQFEEDMLGETRHLGILMQNAFEKLMHKKKAEMREELSKKNMETFNQITVEMIDSVYQDRRKGKGIEKKELDNLVKQAQKKFDKDAYSNFKELYKKYLEELKDDMDAELGGGVKELFKDDPEINIPEATNFIGLNTQATEMMQFMALQ